MDENWFRTFLWRLINRIKILIFLYLWPFKRSTQPPKGQSETETASPTLSKPTSSQYDSQRISNENEHLIDDFDTKRSNQPPPVHRDINSRSYEQNGDQSQSVSTDPKSITIPDKPTSKQNDPQVPTNNYESLNKDSDTKRSNQPPPNHRDKNFKSSELITQNDQVVQAVTGGQSESGSASPGKSNFHTPYEPILRQNDTYEANNYCNESLVENSEFKRAIHPPPVHRDTNSKSSEPNTTDTFRNERLSDDNKSDYQKSIDSKSSSSNKGDSSVDNEYDSSDDSSDDSWDSSNNSSDSSDDSSDDDSDNNDSSDDDSEATEMQSKVIICGLHEKGDPDMEFYKFCYYRLLVTYNPVYTERWEKNPNSCDDNSPRKLLVVLNSPEEVNHLINLYEISKEHGRVPPEIFVNRFLSRDELEKAYKDRERRRRSESYSQ